MKNAAIFLFLLLLPGCSSKEYASRSGVESLLPATGWQSPSFEPTPGEENWLTSFDDPIFPTLVEEAWTHNQSLLALLARRDAQEALTRQQGADRHPLLAAGVRSGRQRQTAASAAGPVAFTGNQHVLTFEFSWEIDLWGRLRDRASAARLDLVATESDLEGAKLSLAGMTGRTWYRLQTSLQLVALARATLNSHRETGHFVQQRFQSGLASSLDLRLAQANESNAEALVQQRLLELDAAARQLQVLLGRYPTHEIANWPVINPTLAPSIPAGLPSDLLERRPDLVAAAARLQAAGWRTGESRKSLLPALRLTGAAGTASPELNDLLSNGISFWNLFGGLTQPIWQGGRLRLAHARQEALAEAAYHEFMQVALNAFAEVEAGLAAESLLRAREDSIKASATQSREAERLAREEYQAGLVDLFSVLEAQRRALEVSTLEWLVREQRLLNRIQLHVALGGSFPPTRERL